MKFYFSKTDSLYRIFKTLEKVPSQKAVQIFIDPEHPFFDNQWWGKQILEIIQKRNLNITFIAEKDANRKYYQQLGLNVQYKEEKPIIKFLKTFSLFLFDIKKFHLNTYNKQKYLFYMVFLFEVLAGVGLLRFLITLLLPSAKITIQVAQQTEDIIYNFRYYPVADKSAYSTARQISIPYYTGSVGYNYQLSISTENIQHIVNPSAWTVKVYNRTSKDLQLLANTRFVTNDWLVFLSKKPLSIPAGLEDNPSEIRVQLYSAETDESWLIMWIRWNIPKWTKLLIRNLDDSYMLWQIWAETIENFTWWDSTSIWSITENDKKVLKDKIKSWVYADKINIVTKEFQLPDAFVFTFDELIKTTFYEPFRISWRIGEKATSLKWEADVSFDFLYLKRVDMQEAFTRYVKERQADSIQLVSIDPNSLVFIRTDDDFWWKTVFTIPTKVSIYQGYDFQRDVKWILQAIKNNVAWKTVEEARKMILQYPEIASVKMKLGFLQGDLIPNVKSRIKVKVEY